MKRTFNQAHCVVALCVAMLTGCTHSNEESGQQTSPMSGIAMADQVCAQCHGLTGESVSPTFPKLAAQQKEYLKLREELANREALDRQNMRVLPDTAEIPAFLDDLNRLAELSGLRVGHGLASPRTNVLYTPKLPSVKRSPSAGS